MSLNILSNRANIAPGTKIVNDVEAEFEYTMLNDDDTTRHLLKAIEGAEYSSKVSYIDAGGYKRSKGQLSVGCKIAILAIQQPNSIINTIECRRIDRANLITYCASGNILDEKKKRGYDDLGAKEINVTYDDQFFDSVKKLNAYIHHINTETIMDAVVIDANPKVIINLEPGVYNVGEASDTSKNYLHSLFRKLGRHEARVSSYSYEDTGIADVAFMLNKEYRVILFNRADMYLDDMTLGLMLNYADKGVILLDYKGEAIDVDDMKRAEIYTRADQIEVAISYD